MYPPLRIFLTFQCAYKSIDLLSVLKTTIRTMMKERWKFRLLLDVDELVFTCAYSSKIRKAWKNISHFHPSTRCVNYIMTYFASGKDFFCCFPLSKTQPRYCFIDPSMILVVKILEKKILETHRSQRAFLSLWNSKVGIFSTNAVFFF